MCKFRLNLCLLIFLIALSSISCNSSTREAVESTETATVETKVTAVSVSPTPDEESDVQKTVESTETATVEIKATVASASPTPNSEPDAQDNPESTDKETMPMEQFSIPTVNQSVPEDIKNIIKEVAFYGQGGGDGPVCGQNYDKPTVMPWYRGEMYLPGKVKLDTCGWAPDELVHITIKHQRWGSTAASVDVQASKVAGDLSYSIVLGDFIYLGYFDADMGDYEVTMEGEINSLYTTLWIDQSYKIYNLFFTDGSKFVVDRDGLKELPDNEIYLYLYRFSPNERVRLFVYNIVETETHNEMIHYGGIFLGWDEFQVNDSGELYINLGQPCEMLSGCNGYEGYSYMAVGEITGAAAVGGGPELESILLNDPVD